MARNKANPIAAGGSAGGTPRAAPRVRRIEDQVLGWCVSAAVHAVAVIVFALVALPSCEARRPDAPGERDVGIVVGDRPSEIVSDGIGPVGTNSLMGELALPQMKDSSRIDPIWDVSEAGTSPAKRPRILSIDVGSGGDLPASMKGDWTRFAAGGGGEGTGGASFFGLEARGRKFVFVVDRSGSMGGPKLDAAKAELIRAVRGLGRNARFYTIFFNTAHQAMPARQLVRATESNKRRHFAWVSGLDGQGGTDPTSAMTLALSLKPDAIWLLSDGMFKARAADEIRRLNGGRKVQVHTIAFYSREGEAVLRRIAEQNRGRYRFVSPASIGLGVRR